MSYSALDSLIAMSNDLGRPEYDLVIFGEGNTSALVENNCFYVKCSGTELRTITAEGFALLNRMETTNLLDKNLTSDKEILDNLLKMRVDGGTKYPSVETIMHAYLLGLPGVNFIGHTHPTSVNSLLCSVNAEKLVNMRVFPDQIVCCGEVAAFIPYTDPGLPLARKVRDVVNEYMDKYGIPPKAIMIQNHGMFALGKTTRDVMACSMMWSKTARVLIGAMSCGGINPMPESEVNRINNRPDEKIRQNVIGGKE